MIKLHIHNYREPLPDVITNASQDEVMNEIKKLVGDKDGSLFIRFEEDE